jgi:GTP-binding protein
LCGNGAPGKTRLANIYRVARGAASPFYLVDLPGYGHARGNSDDFGELTEIVFNRRPAALLLVDARHPGLESDRAAWTWVRTAAEGTAIAATKIDKLARGERIRALRELESVLEHAVLPVSAATGEGLDQLWIVIDKLANNRRARPLNPRNPRRATAPLPRKK